MADNPLFNLDAEGRWRLAFDSQQWIIQRRKGPPRPSGVVPGRDSGWMAVSFVGGTKTTLHRLFREKGNRHFPACTRPRSGKNLSPDCQF